MRNTMAAKGFVLTLIVAAVVVALPSLVSAATFDEFIQERAKIFKVRQNRDMTQREIDVAKRDWDAAASQPGLQDKMFEAEKKAAADPRSSDTTNPTNKCTSWIYDFSFQGCIMDPILKALGSYGLMFGAYVLRGVGWLFDILIQTVIVDFGKTLTTLKLADPIAKGWTFFRDVSNILIIGVFIFIALCIILGIKEYGQKKLIANVLIVAVLINFSLLFTRLVIDFSNFTAYQIYSAMAGTSASGTFLKISEGFLGPMGITSVANDSRQVVEKLAADTNGGGAFQAFVFGMVAGLLLIAVALVLLYGCILVAARGILFFFLMITAALAFASYLIPGMAQGEYGFHKWWKTLLNSAIFAPLLMIFLAVSLLIVKQASSGVGPGTPLGTIAANPTTLGTTTDGWTTIFLYVLGAGLLFLSLKFSNKFAGSISGLGYVPSLFKGTMIAATAAPFALGMSRVVAPVLQRTLGSRALGRSEALRGAAREANLNATTQTARALQLGTRADNAAKRGDMVGAAQYGLEAETARKSALSHQKEVASLLQEAAKEKEKADKKYNLMDTSGAKAINSAIGNTGPLSGESEKGAKGYASRVEEKAKGAAQMASGAQLGEKENTQVRRKAEKDAEEKHFGDMENRRALRQAAAASEMSAKATRDAAASNKDKVASKVEQDKLTAEYIASAAEIARTKSEKEMRDSQHSDEIGSIINQIRATDDPVLKRALQEQLSVQERVRAADMRDFERRIARSERDLSDKYEQPRVQAEQELAKAEAALTRASRDLRTADQSINKLTQTIKDEVETVMKTHVAASNVSIEEVAGVLGEREGGRDVAEAARSAYRKRKGSAARLSQLFKDNDVDMGTGEKPPSTT